MKNTIKYTFSSIIRATIKFFCFLAVFHTVNLLFMRFTEKFNEENRSGWTLSIMIFVILSVVWVFYHYNSRAKRHFIESCHSHTNSDKRKSPVNILLSLDFLTDTSVCFVLSLISSFVFGYTEIEMLFFEQIYLHLIAKKLLIGIFVGLCFFFVHWFTIYDIQKKWRRYKEIETKHELLIITAYLCFITVMYTIGFYLAISYLPGLPAYIFLLKKFFWHIVVITVAIFILIHFHRISKRKKFISQLKKSSLTFHFELSDIKKPYLSIFKQTLGASFVITAHQKSYACKLISGKSKNVSIIFSDQGFLLFKHTVRLGKSDLFSYYSRYDYSFESDLKKCLILTCIPVNCYFKDANGQMRKIDTGERIGEYTVFSANGFLNALERNCIDR